MRSTGIKSHITAILAILLTIGMLLTTLVITIFWQQSLLRGQREKSRAILSTVANMASQTEDDNVLLSPEGLLNLQNDLGASCLMLSINNHRTSIPHQCGPEEEALQHNIEAAISTGLASTQIIDAKPGLPFLRDQTLITALPLEQPGRYGAIGAAISLQPVYAQVSQGRRLAYIYILVNVIILTTIGLFRFIQMLVRPLEHLVTLTDNYQNAETSLFLSEQESNEFDQLAIALNRMAQRLDADKQKLRETVQSLEQANLHLRATQQKMVQTEKMAALGKLAAGLAHEIGNPLGIVQGYLELLGQPGLSKEEQQQFSSRSMQELERINRLIHQLLNFARSRSDHSGSAAIHPLLQELVDMLQTQKNLATLQFQLHLQATYDRVALNGESLHQIFLNCLLNAIDAITEHKSLDQGRIRLSTVNITSDDDQPFIKIMIEDNGIGIKDTDLDSLFDPFFTTKEPGKGTGLGLSVSYALVESGHGQMSIVGQAGQGATLSILLPVLVAPS